MQGIFLTNFQISDPMRCIWRSWESESADRYLHGRSLIFKFMFECQTLQAGRGMDDALLRPFIDVLRADLDGRILVAESDPHLNTLRVIEAHGLCQILVLSDVGTEPLAKWVFVRLNDWMYSQGISPRVIIRSIECGERDVAMGCFVGNL